MDFHGFETKSVPVRVRVGFCVREEEEDEEGPRRQGRERSRERERDTSERLGGRWRLACWRRLTWPLAGTPGLLAWPLLGRLGWVLAFFL